VATNPAGEKWSKQTLAPAISPAEGVALLARAMRFLGQPVPEEAAGLSLHDFWTWARAHWSMAAVPRCRALVG